HDRNQVRGIPSKYFRDMPLKHASILLLRPHPSDWSVRLELINLFLCLIFYTIELWLFLLQKGLRFYFQYVSSLIHILQEQHVLQPGSYLGTRSKSLQYKYCSWTV